DDKNPAEAPRRSHECVGISEFAAEVEPAEKSEHLAESSLPGTAQTLRQVELRAFAQDHARTITAGIGRRKQEYTIPRLFHSDKELLRNARQLANCFSTRTGSDGCPAACLAPTSEAPSPR